MAPELRRRLKQVEWELSLQYERFYELAARANCTGSFERDYREAETKDDHRRLERKRHRRDELIAKIRQLPPEQQAELARMLQS